MKKKLIAALICSLLAVPAAQAAGIDVTLKYNNENNSISVSGSADTVKDNTSFTLVAEGPDGEVVFSDQTIGTDVVNGKSEFKFREMPFGAAFAGGEYKFIVSGYKLGSASPKTYSYTAGSDLLTVLKNLEGLSGGFKEFIELNAVALSVDETASKALKTNGTAVFSELMAAVDYDLPEKCETEDEYNELQECAKEFRNDYDEFIAIASFNDIASAADMTAWVNKYKEKYSIAVDDTSTTDIDEAAIFSGYAEKNMGKTQMAASLITAPVKTLHGAVSRLYEKALLCTIETEHYSETTVILRDFYELFPYNKTNFAKLTATELVTAYSTFAGHAYASYTAAVTEFDRIVLNIINSRSSGGKGSGGGSGSGGGGGGSSVSSAVSSGNAGGVIASATEPSQTGVFNDIASVEWAKEAIEYLHANGILSGKSAGVFAPDDSVTRAEFIKMITEALGLERNANTEKFADVSDTAWYAEYVYAAKAAGIVSGDTENNFNPESRITREDITVILYRAYGIESSLSDISFDDAADVSEYAANAVAYFTKAGIINGMGDNKFMPKANATRAQAAKLVYESMIKYGEE